MKQKLSILVIAVMLFAACDKDKEPDTPKNYKPTQGVTFTTSLEEGEPFLIYISASEENKADVWVDLNYNGKREKGEEVDNWANGTIFTLGKEKRITVFGKASELSPRRSEIVEVEIHKADELERLYLENNSIKSLDVTHAPNIKSINCTDNSFTEEGKRTLISSLPQAPAGAAYPPSLSYGGENNAPLNDADRAQIKGKGWSVYP